MTRTGTANPVYDDPRWRQARNRILQQSRTCHICGADGADTVDHLIELQDGADPYDADNLAPAHRACNARKGSRRRHQRTQRPPSSLDDQFTPARSGLLLTHQLTQDPGRPARSQGSVVPRLESRRFRGPNLLADCERIAADVLGIELLPWQRYALGRMTELRRRNGRLVLRWPEVVLTVGRQNGKTTLLQVLAVWRLLEGERQFGQAQQLVSLAQSLKVARLPWEQATRRLREQGLTTYVLNGTGFELTEVGDNKWRVLSGKLAATTGYSADLAICDEAWALDREVVDQGVRPQLLRREQAQLVVVSTAGDGRSDLLTSMRERALSGDPNVLLLEWSAPPGSDPSLENTWRWANPWWTKELEASLRHAYESQPENVFASQALNIWQTNVDGWVSPGQWERCRAPGVAPAGGVVAVDVAPMGEAWSAVWAGAEVHGRVPVRAMRRTKPDDVWEWVARLQDDDPEVRAMVGVSVRDRVPHTVRVDGLVGRREIRDWLGHVHAMVSGGAVAHDGDQVLTDHMLTAQVAQSSTGVVQFTSRVAGAFDLARVLVFAVGAVTSHDVKPVTPVMV